MAKAKFQTVEELNEAVDAYFEKCKGHVMLDNEGRPVFYKGNPVYEDRTIPSVVGLNLALGFSTRWGLKEYLRRATEEDKKDPDSMYTAIKTALSRVEEATVAAGFTKEGFQGARLQLFNYCQYKDKGETIEVNNHIKITPEQAEQALKSLGYEKAKKEKKKCDT